MSFEIDPRLANELSGEWLENKMPGVKNGCDKDKMDKAPRRFCVPGTLTLTSWKRVRAGRGGRELSEATTKVASDSLISGGCEGSRRRESLPACPAALWPRRRDWASLWVGPGCLGSRPPRRGPLRVGLLAI